MAGCRAVVCVIVLVVALSGCHVESLSLIPSWLRPARPEVVVEEGTLRGKTETFTERTYIGVNKKIDLFLGVPFADPPARFEAPQPKSPWGGVYDATEFKPACQQKPSSIYPSRSEDCLYLNVFAPNPAPANASVMVWIHGGGFSEGTAMTYAAYGHPLVAVGDVILVSINYRLGIFGHFTTKDAEAPGNYGMLDQTAALRWVYNNIQAFGGDPNRITIFGESAGSASVSFHLLSPLSRNYFSQAIMQSGTAFSNWAFRDEPEVDIQHARILGMKMNCDVTNSSTLVTCLRSADVDELREAAGEIHFTYPVTVDGTFLEDTPENLLESGDVKRAAILAGFNRDEGSINTMFGLLDPPPVSGETFSTYVKTGLTWLGVTNEAVHDVVLQEYIDWTIADDPDADYWRSTIDFTTDLDYACPTDAILRYHTAAGDPTFEYYMTHVPSRSIFDIGRTEKREWLGAGHAEDLPLVFGWPFIYVMRIYVGFNLTPEENELSVNIMRFWTNFAKSGDPSKPDVDAPRGEGEASWPEFSLPGLRYKELSVGLGEGRAVRARRCAFWREYFPMVLNTLGAGGNFSAPSMADLAGAVTADPLGADPEGEEEAEQHGDHEEEEEDEEEGEEEEEEIDELREEWREFFDSWKTEMAAWKTEFIAIREGGNRNCTN